MCVTSLGFSLYCNVRQTHTERTLRHLREFDERLMDLEMQLQMQQQQLQHVSHTLTKQREQLIRNNEEDEVDDDDADDDYDNSETDTINMDYTSRALSASNGAGNLNILHLKDAKDVTQAVRLLTRQVGELHRLRRDVSQLQLSRRQQHRRQTGLGGGSGTSSHERLGVGAGGGECGCQPGEFENF